MMKRLILISILCLCSMALSFVAYGETIVSISNGKWDNPAIWDKNKVPGAMDTVYIRHRISMDGNLVFGKSSGQLSVQPEGQLYADTLHIDQASFTNMGLVGLTAILNEGIITNNGFIEVANLQNESQGIFTSTGILRILQSGHNRGELLVMDMLELEGMLTNDGVLELQSAGTVHILDTLLNSVNGLFRICGTVKLKQHDLSNLANEISVPSLVNNGQIEGCDGTIRSEIRVLVTNQGTINGNVKICLKAGDYINNGIGAFIEDCCILFSVKAGPNRKTCLGEEVVLGGFPTVENGVEPYTISWESSAAVINADVENPTVNPTSPTLYVVAVTDSENCSAVDSVVIEPVAHLLVDLKRGPEVICLGDSVRIGTQRTVRCGNPPYTINWSPNENISDPTVANPVVWPTKTTAYTITASDADTTITEEVVVIVEERPTTAVAGADQITCSSSSIQLSANEPLTGIGRWIKVDGVGDIRNPFNPLTTLVNPGSEDTLSMVWMIRNGICFSSDTTIIVNLEGPEQADAGEDQALCNNTSTEIQGNIPEEGSSGLWSLVSGSAEILDPQNPNTTVSGLIVGEEVTLRWNITKDICQGSTFDDILVRTSEAPSDLQVQLAFTDTTIKVGESIQLFAEGGVSYRWEPEDFLSNPDISDPIAAPTEDITYSVSVITDSGCLLRDQVSITVDDERNYFIPEMFSPNGDGVNDMLFVNSFGYKALDFKLFNRFGQLVFSTNDSSVGWDGRFNGQLQSQDTYVYSLVLETFSDEIINEKGSLQLVR